MSRCAASVLVAGGFLFILAGCGTSPTIRALTGGSLPARPEDYPILVTEGLADRPYEAIAEVTTRAYDDRVVDELGRAELRKTARRLGGDAVIRVSRNGVVREELGYRPGALLRLGTRFVDRATLSGVVVRYVPLRPEGR